MVNHCGTSLLALFSKMVYQRVSPGKIWRNPWFQFLKSILDIYSPLVLYDPTFSYLFIRSILKSHNLIAYSVSTKTTRYWSVPILIESSCQIRQTRAFLSFIFLQCDCLFKKKNLKNRLVVPFSLAERKMRFIAKDSAIRK